MCPDTAVRLARRDAEFLGEGCHRQVEEVGEAWSKQEGLLNSLGLVAQCLPVERGGGGKCSALRKLSGMGVVLGGWAHNTAYRAFSLHLTNVVSITNIPWHFLKPTRSESSEHPNAS